MQIIIPNELGFALLKLVPQGTTCDEAANILLKQIVEDSKEKESEGE